MGPAGWGRSQGRLAPGRWLRFQVAEAAVQHENANSFHALTLTGTAGRLSSVSSNSVAPCCTSKKACRLSSVLVQLRSKLGATSRAKPHSKPNEGSDSHKHLLCHALQERSQRSKIWSVALALGMQGIQMQDAWSAASAAIPRRAAIVLCCDRSWLPTKLTYYEQGGMGGIDQRQQQELLAQEFVRLQSR